MEDNSRKADALLLHIEHTKPIEISEFVTSLNAVGGLFSSFAKKNGDCKDVAQAKLYVEKIEEGCIDITLVNVMAASILPFMENMNVILEFSSYLKGVIEYFTKGKGEKPELDLQECKNLNDMMLMTANDKGGSTTVGAICKADKGNVFSGCTFNFYESNSAQNQLKREADALRSVVPADNVLYRQLMTIYQMRSDMSTDKGNKAVIDAISDKKLAVVFESDELKERILHSDCNPTKKAFLVDVVVQSAGGRVVAYKVMSLHEIIDID